MIHGKADPLVPVEGGIDTARKIRDAKLALIDGYGHDFPPQLLGRLADLVLGNAAAA